MDQQTNPMLCEQTAHYYGTITSLYSDLLTSGVNATPEPIHKLETGTITHNLLVLQVSISDHKPR